MNWSRQIGGVWPRRRFVCFVMLIIQLLSVSFFVPMRSSLLAADKLGEEGFSLRLFGKNENTSPIFKKFIYFFPVPRGNTLSALSGSVSIASRGQGFAEALFSVYGLSTASACPVAVESFDSYTTIHARYPDLQTVARFIVKAPRGTSAINLPTEVDFPVPVPAGQCIALILDGAVLHVGGDFTMSSDIVARLVLAKDVSSKAQLLSLDDEVCFDRSSGCELATPKAVSTESFIKVLRFKDRGTLRGLYGSVSDSAFGWDDSKRGAWSAQNEYLIYPHCQLPDGLHGPDSYLGEIPKDAIKLLDISMTGAGQVVLQKSIYKAYRGIQVNSGDCLAHIVQVLARKSIGGVDAESQIIAVMSLGE